MAKEKIKVVGGAIIQDANGSTLMKEEAICERWIKYFEELMNKEKEMVW